MTKDHPALVALMSSRWDNAFGHLHHASEKTLGQARAQRLLDVCGDRRLVQAEIHDTVDALYAVGTRDAGQLALAWEMLTCNPRIPTTLHRVLPQLQHALDAADLDADLDVDVRERLSIWWAAGAGDYVKVTRSMFAVAAAVLAGEIETESALEPFEPVDVAQFFRTPYAGPTLTVMPAAKATKLNNYNKVFQDILDKALPLVCARDLAEARKRLEYEFPHASAALSVLFKDLREGEPIKLRPTILWGSPGVSKSRLVRKWASAVGLMHVHRYDGASSADSHFAGTSKGWSNTEASVPARAVLSSRTANPLVFIDEIDKCSGGRGSPNGSLRSALLPFLESETAARYRDQSLDCELQLDHVSFLCTANDVTALPDYLRDRFRIVKVPAPTLADLPLLAGNIVDEMLLEGDEWAGSVAPFAPDELAVMSKAWAAAGGFSIRKLQKIVRATLEARDASQMRH